MQAVLRKKPDGASPEAQPVHIVPSCRPDRSAWCRVWDWPPTVCLALGQAAQLARGQSSASPAIRRQMTTRAFFLHMSSVREKSCTAMVYSKPTAREQERGRWESGQCQEQGKPDCRGQGVHLGKQLRRGRPWSPDPGRLPTTYCEPLK